MNQKSKKQKFTNSPNFYNSHIGDCDVIDQLIDSRMVKGITLCCFDKEVFPGIIASLKVDIATNQPVVLDLSSPFSE